MQEAGKAMESIGNTEQLYFISTGLTEDKETGNMLFTTNALFDNGLPAGIELRFAADEKKQILLHDIRFHNMLLDRETFLKTPELQRIVASLPYEMQKQACANLHVAKAYDGSFGRMIVANGSDRSMYEEKQDAAKKDFMERNFQRSGLVTFGSDGGSDLDDALEESDREQENDGWEKD